MSATALRVTPIVSRAPILVLPGERVLCPRLHQLPDNIVELPHGLRRCMYRDRLHGQSSCRAWLWVFDHGDGTRTVVPLRDEQVAYLRQHVTMSVAEVRDFIGMRWTA